MDDREIALEVWKTTIDVQKHFNDIGLKIRTAAVTVVGAFAAVAGYAIKEGQHSFAGAVVLAALACWISFYLMDRLWYHRLLQSAVRHGEKIEKDLQATIPNIDLTTRITAGSPVFGRSAAERLSFFYGVVGAILALAGTALIFT